MLATSQRCFSPRPEKSEEVVDSAREALEFGGLFVNAAPLGFAAGDTNLYRYVGNSPISLTDPSGLAPHDHHFMVQEFADEFHKVLRLVDQDFHVDQFASQVEKSFVHGSTKGTQLATDVVDQGQQLSKGGEANNRWKRLFGTDAYKSAPEKMRGRMILEEMLEFAESKDIDLSDLSKYGRVGNVSNNANSLHRFLSLADSLEVDQTKYANQLGKMANKILESPYGRKLMQSAKESTKDLVSKFGKEALSKYGGKALGGLGVVFAAASVYQHGVKGAIAQELGVSELMLDHLVRGDVALNTSWFKTSLDQVSLPNAKLQIGQQMRIFDKNGIHIGYSEILSIYPGDNPGTFQVFISERNGTPVAVNVSGPGRYGIPDGFQPTEAVGNHPFNARELMTPVPRH
jgi:hypothetical protein